MPVDTAEIDRLRQLTRAQLQEIARDPLQPDAVQRAARGALRGLTRRRLLAAVRGFDSALPVFTDLTQRLRAITEAARKDPVGDAVSQLSMTLRRLGQVFDKVDGVVHEAPVKAAPPGPAAPRAEPTPESGPVPESVPEPVPEPVPAQDPAPIPESMAGPEPVPAQEAVNVPLPPGDAPSPIAPTPAPPAGAATATTRFADIAAEYAATFQAATVNPERAPAVDHVRRRLVGFAGEYRSVAALTGVPWHVVGLIHAMESSFNFGTHLHNGDSLTHRTRRAPAGRPGADVADPPFAWSTSAIDALTRGNHKLNLVASWTLERQLYELERYNGFGYRFRGIATPYLWSGSDRYVRGKFVRDGVFDPDAVSAQIGAGVVMKAMLQAGDI